MHVSYGKCGGENQLVRGQCKILKTVAYNLVIGGNAYIVMGYHLTDDGHGQKRMGYHLL